jgi:N-acyl-D-aspartate/D-glutamate deacylase
VLDLLIRNATLYDGTGAAPRVTDVGVQDGRVVAMEPRLDAVAAETRDATGLWLTPGFLDIHTHYDLEVEIAPRLDESLRHGVTTVVMGHCSLSITMGEPQDLADIFQRVENFPPALIRRWLESAVSWSSPAGYIAHLRTLPLGPNVAPMLGHSALRAAVMGLERSLRERAGDDDLARMRRRAEEALEAGCIGISVDMVPWHMISGRHRGRTIPSQHADLREVRMLADVCRARDAVFQITPNPQRPASFAEILRLAPGGTRLPLRVTVLSALDSVVDRRLWRLFPATLFVFNRLLGCNIRFQTLTEPFTVFSDGPVTPLFEEFPAGVRLNDCESADERRSLWRSPAFREQFRRQWRGAHRTFHRRLELMTVVRCPDASLEGKTFAELGDLDAFLDLLERYDTELRWVSTGANDREEIRDRLLRHPHILPGFTDSGAHVRNLGFYDSALTLLRQAVTRGTMPVERAVARVTGEPARWYGLDCGTIRVGGRADLELLRPQGLRAPAAEMVEVADPLLDGAVRVVKRGSEAAIDSVYVRGEVLSLVHVSEREHVRRRMSIDGRPHPFTDYWDVFVLKHQRLGNVALHVLGVILFYGLLALAAATRNAWWLLALPASQLVGLIGHAVFEQTPIDLQDAVFSMRASRCLNRMFFRIVTGRYGADIRERRQRLAEARA